MPLDDPNQVTPNEAASMNNTVLRYGLIGGLLFIVLSLISYLTGLASPTSFSNIAISLALSLVLYFGIMVVAIRHHRDQELGGYITFGRAFLVGFLVVLIAGLISNLFNYVYMTLIEPGYLANMADEMQGMYERMGLSEGQMEEAMSQVENMTPGRVILQGLIGQLVIGSIAAAIVAAVMKRKPEF